MIAAPRPASGPGLCDSLGRQVRYLRLSITPACSMRCTYCRPRVRCDPPSSQSLSADDIERLVRRLVERWGLRKVRLTGGEPTARGDLIDIITRLARIDGLADLAMTTNGLTLARHAADYRRAGLRRINISLDSLRPRTFERMTGLPALHRALEGIDAALDAGLHPVRLNTVVLAGENDDELPELVRFAAERDIEIRFIELMPMGPLAPQWHDRYVSAAGMMARLSDCVAAWSPLEQGHESARRHRVRLTGGRQATIGFITPMSCHFCDACNRLRITADGHVYPCLMDRPRGNVFRALMPVFDPERLDGILRDSLRNKAASHPLCGFTPMTLLGG